MISHPPPLEDDVFVLPVIQGSSALLRPVRPRKRPTCRKCPEINGARQLYDACAGECSKKAAVQGKLERASRKAASRMNPPLNSERPPWARGTCPGRVNGVLYWGEEPAWYTASKKRSRDSEVEGSASGSGSGLNLVEIGRNQAQVSEKNEIPPTTNTSNPARPTTTADAAGGRTNGKSTMSQISRLRSDSIIAASTTRLASRCAERTRISGSAVQSKDQVLQQRINDLLDEVGILRGEMT